MKTSVSENPMLELTYKRRRCQGYGLRRLTPRRAYIERASGFGGIKGRLTLTSLRSRPRLIEGKGSAAKKQNQ